MDLEWNGMDGMDGRNGMEMDHRNDKWKDEWKQRKRATTGFQIPGHPIVYGDKIIDPSKPTVLVAAVTMMHSPPIRLSCGICRPLNRW